MCGTSAQEVPPPKGLVPASGAGTVAGGRGGSPHMHVFSDVVAWIPAKRARTV